MRLDTGRLSLEIPDAFQDVTSYVFEQRPLDPEKGGPPDRLSIEFEPMPAHVSAQDVITHARRSMERAGGASFTEGSALAGRIPAATLKVDVAGGAMFVAALRWPGSLVAQVRYESRREDAGPVFDRIVSSIRPIGVRAAPPAGLVRRRASRLWLEMPVELAPLSSYTFAADGGRARLFVENDPSPPGEAPDFASWVDHGALESVEVEPENEGSFAADRRPIEERSWRADRVGAQGDLLESTWFHAAWAEVAEGEARRVWMIERGRPSLGEAHWADIVAEMRLVAEGP